MTSDAETVKQYINELPEDRKDIITSIRKIILSSLPDGYEEVG